VQSGNQVRHFFGKNLGLGFDKIATGLYARIERQEGAFRLLAGSDPNKDQSYFLCRLKQDQLARAVFPIGSLLKTEVRTLAREAGLPSATKKDSQGICFIGNIKVRIFEKIYFGDGWKNCRSVRKKHWANVRDWSSITIGSGGIGYWRRRSLLRGYPRLYKKNLMVTDDPDDPSLYQRNVRWLIYLGQISRRHCPGRVVFGFVIAIR
jgi:hypothetical protein